MTSRRGFLSAGLVGLTAKAERPIAGSFVNDAFTVGHRLRDRVPFPPPKRQEKVAVAIVGGGIAGLSAAWRLDKRGMRNFVLIEMERQPGGNARWGENEVSAYPWAAHYIPVPNRSSTLVRELMEELGVMQDGHYNERDLCFSPQERLFIHGRWQDGIEPALDASPKDREQMRRFADRIREYHATGQFTIPMEQGAKPSPLDGISMQEWLRREKFDSPYVDWYVNYACRDDYGARADATSAWAGVHYFASRENEEKGPLTWPEGNGWVARRLIAKLQKYLRTGAPVHRIERQGRAYRVLGGDVEYRAEAVIFCAPTFLASYLIDGFPHVASIQYSPWLTANLTLERWPHEQFGTEPAWDNTIYDSPALGYVVATHQTLRRSVERTVWTFYWALAEHTPAAGRRFLLEKDWGYWKEAILHDLQRAHADIRSCVSRIDVMRLGHAMVRPSPGFLSNVERLRLVASGNGLFFGNSDLSGLSLFEEAQYRGVHAADRTMRYIAGRGL